MIKSTTDPNDFMNLWFTAICPLVAALAGIYFIYTDIDENSA